MPDHAPPAAEAAPARLERREEAGAVVLAFSGRLDAAGAGAIWTASLRGARLPKGAALGIDISGVTLCDTAGAALLLAAEAAHGGTADWRGGTPAQRALIERVRAVPPGAAPPPPPAISLLAPLRDGGTAALQGIAFLGEASVALVRLPARRRMLRPADLARLADQAGVRAIPLVVLMGYLIGLILAFQSAIPLRRFGADVLVAYLVTVSLVRELGPLLSAVILAGRTGSAFAAEIGTMKVNEELDALATMGLSTMTMQVLPRMMAAMAVMPVLTIILILSGLAGMATVMLMLGFPMAAVIGQVHQSARLQDLLGGLFKAVCFGAAVAAIGCRSGLGTGKGPRAVGLAATGAVVGGIVATILMDGIFALIFYRLGL